VVRGQFKGYKSEEGVSPESTVETFVALRLYIDSSRWRGVPFYIRAGESLPVTVTEATAILRQPPAIFSDQPPMHNYLRFRVTPNLAIAIVALVKKPGDEMTGEEVELLATEHSDSEEMLAYEELLGDAMHGDPTRFAREDYVEEAWRIVDPIFETLFQSSSMLPVPGDLSKQNGLFWREAGGIHLEAEKIGRLRQSTSFETEQQASRESWSITLQ